MNKKTNWKEWREWRPHNDLARLSTALSEEILNAADWELHLLRAETGCQVKAVAQDVRELIAAASGEVDNPSPGFVPAEGERVSGPCVRQH